MTYTLFCRFRQGEVYCGPETKAHSNAHHFDGNLATAHVKQVFPDWAQEINCGDNVKVMHLRNTN